MGDQTNGRSSEPDWNTSCDLCNVKAKWHVRIIAPKPDQYACGHHLGQVLPQDRRAVVTPLRRRDHRKARLTDERVPQLPPSQRPGRRGGA